MKSRDWLELAIVMLIWETACSALMATISPWFALPEIIGGLLFGSWFATRAVARR